MNNIKILQRNQKECNSNTKSIGNPSERTRYNQADDLIPKEPNAKDFSELLLSLSDDFSQTSENLNEMSLMLKRDEKHQNSDAIENQRRTIQNNLDTVRYCSPLLVNLSKLVIPIGDPEEKLRVND